MRYLANENIDSTTSSLNSHPGMSLMACPTLFQMPAISRPESSRGNSCSREPKPNSKSCRSISIRVGLKRGSSSWSTMVNPERALLRSSVTGTKTNGALYFCPALSSRVQLRKPMARKSVLEPPSCSAVRAPRYSSVSRTSISLDVSATNTSLRLSASSACRRRTSSRSRCSYRARSLGSAPSMRSGRVSSFSD
ncbi:hypothetical protein D3C76_1272290 [compost metagenome]